MNSGHAGMSLFSHTASIKAADKQIKCLKSLPYYYVLRMFALSLPLIAGTKLWDWCFGHLTTTIQL